MINAATVDDLIARLDAIKTMQATFQQTVYSAHRKRLQSTKGSLAIVRPNRFRWRTDSPNQQVIIADGKTIWIYDIDLEQVSKKPQKGALVGSPAAFLSGDSRLIAKDYRVKSPQKDHYLLSPKQSSSDFRQIEMIFFKQRLTQMKLTDGLGQTTELKFNNVRVNHSLSTKLFSFTVPNGVDVIAQE